MRRFGNSFCSTRSICGLFCAVLFLVALPVASFAADLVVTNTEDSLASPRQGSLRQTIFRAGPFGDAGPGPHRIVFDIPVSDPGAVKNKSGEVLYWRIRVTSTLAFAGVTIDGRSAGTSPDGSPRILIENLVTRGENTIPQLGDPPPSETNQALFRLIGGDTAIYGLAFANSVGYGIALFDSHLRSRQVIQGCWFGGSFPGSKVLRGSGQSAILVQWAGDALIGGTEPGEGNLFVGNGFLPAPVRTKNETEAERRARQRATIYVTGDAFPDGKRHTKVQVIGNRFGTDGETLLGNADYNVLIENDAEALVSENILHGSDGVGVIGGTRSVTIENNVIGLEDLGDAPSICVDLIDSADVTVRGNRLLTSETAVSLIRARGVRVLENTIVGAPAADAPFNFTLGVYVSASPVVIGDPVDPVAGANVLGGLGTGIVVSASPATIVGNLVGLEADGKTPRANGIGIRVERSKGGVRVVDNTVSANLVGIVVEDSEAINLLGNFVGTDRDGLSALPNGTGIAVVDSNGIALGASRGDEAETRPNLVSANLEIGIVVVRSSDVRISESLIGTDLTGRNALGNGQGIHAVGATEIEIGGDFIGNVISGNLLHGVNLEMASGGSLRGNKIGTDLTGRTALPNGVDGVTLVQTDAVKIIDNVIAANGRNGVQVSQSTDAVIEDNSIGVAADGERALGNGAHGIALAVNAMETRIEGNAIAHNGKNGLFLSSDAGSYNDVIENSFFDNAELAIDLDGLEPADPAGLAGVANGGQKAPEILSAAYSGGDDELVVTYRVEPVSSEPGAGDIVEVIEEIVVVESKKNILVELYLSDGAGEGKDYLDTFLYEGAGESAEVSLFISKERTAGRRLVALARAGARRRSGSEFSNELAIGSSEPTAPVFVRGDSNGDAKVNIADVGYIGNYLFGLPLGRPVVCAAALNANADARINIADLSYTGNFVFGISAALPPPAPFPACGPVVRAEDAAIGCEESAMSCR